MNRMLNRTRLLALLCALGLISVAVTASNERSALRPETAAASVIPALR